MSKYVTTLWKCSVWLFEILEKSVFSLFYRVYSTKTPVFYRIYSIKLAFLLLFA